jgi:hypothetical protein
MELYKAYHRGGTFDKTSAIVRELYHAAQGNLVPGVKALRTEGANNSFIARTLIQDLEEPEPNDDPRFLSRFGRNRA